VRPPLEQAFPRPAVVGVVNVTPDSFSDGGHYLRPEAAVVLALAHVDEGAALVDVGGESTRPGSEGISAEEELRRIVPVLEGLQGLPVSVDTSKAAVARHALELGAVMVNDVTALRGDPDLAGVVADAGAYLCLMHMLGEPRTMQDDPRYDDVVSEVKFFLEERLAFAVDAEIRATQVGSTPEGVAFLADGVPIRSPLRGSFNVENCLAAFATARSLGVDDLVAAEAISSVRGVPGRGETVEAGQAFLVMVDYAHTPTGVENVLRAARSLAKDRVIAVVGCGGDRDRAKRPGMGFAATANADLAIITSDNPRSEDPLAIIAEITPGAERGAKEQGTRFVVEPDRRAAIRLAMSEAAPGDVVVIAGKGHETYQELANGTIPFDDRTVAEEELRSTGKAT